MKTMLRILCFTLVFFVRNTVADPFELGTVISVDDYYKRGTSYYVLETSGNGIRSIFRVVDDGQERIKKGEAVFVENLELFNKVCSKTTNKCFKISQ